MTSTPRQEAQVEWPRWQEAEPALAIVEDLKDLPRWMREADPDQRDAVLTALLRVARTDQRATVVAAWLLVPGASLLAAKMRRLADVIDEVVAGQLWIQICAQDPSEDRYVAKRILSRVEREALAELGIVTSPNGVTRRGRRPCWLRSSTSPCRRQSRRKWRNRVSNSQRSCDVRLIRARCPTPIVTCCSISRMRLTRPERRCGVEGLG